MEQHPPISVAVVGAGWVGRHRHLPALRDDPRFRIAAVLDRYRPRSAVGLRLAGLPESLAAESLDAIEWGEGARAITIATPPAAHGPLLAAARERGLHVLTEKPFTLTLAEALAEAEPDARTVAVMHNFQFARSAQRLWDDLAAGRLGAPRAVSAVQLSNPARRLPAWYEELPLGLFFDESPHLLYLLRRVAPELRLVSSDRVPGPAGRATPRLLTARYTAGELPLTLSMNFEAAVSEWHFAIHGADAIGVIDLFRDIYLRLPNDGAHTTRSVLRTSLAAMGGHLAGYLAAGPLHLRGRLRYGVDEVVRRFGDAILAGGDPALIGRADALAVRQMQAELIEGTAR